MSFSYSPEPTGSHSGPFDPEATELPEVLRQLHVPHRSEGAVIVVAVASAPQDRDWANLACIRTAEMFGRGVGGALLLDTAADTKGLATRLGVSSIQTLQDVLRDPTALDHAAGLVEGYPFVFLPAGGPTGDRTPLLESPSWGSLLERVTQDGTTVVLQVQLATSGVESIIGRADAVVLLGRTTDLLAVLVEGFDGPVVWLGPPAADADAAVQDDPGDPNARRVRGQPVAGMEAGGPDALDGAEDRSGELPALESPPTAEATTQQKPDLDDELDPEAASVIDAFFSGLVSEPAVSESEAAEAQPLKAQPVEPPEPETVEVEPPEAETVEVEPPEPETVEVEPPEAETVEVEPPEAETFVAPDLDPPIVETEAEPEAAVEAEPEPEPGAIPESDVEPDAEPGELSPASLAEVRERTALEAEFEGLPSIEEVPEEPKRRLSPVVLAGAGVLAAAAATLMLLGRGPTTAVTGSTDPAANPETAQTSEEDLWARDPLNAIRRDEGQESPSGDPPDAPGAPGAPGASDVSDAQDVDAPDAYVAAAVAALPEPGDSEPPAPPVDAAEPSDSPPADPVPVEPEPEPQSPPPSTPTPVDPVPVEDPPPAVEQMTEPAAETEEQAPPLAPPPTALDLTPPPPNSGVAPGTMAFGVEVGRHSNLDAARSQAVSLRSSNSGVMFNVVPVDEGVEGGIVYRVVAGPAATATDAEGIQSSLGDVASSIQATVRATHWTYLLGVFGDYAEAITHVTNVQNSGLPAYLVEIPVPEDRVVYRAYSGAFGTEAEAAALGALLEGAGYGPTRLVERVGRPMR